MARGKEPNKSFGSFPCVASFHFLEGSVIQFVEVEILKPSFPLSF